MGWISSDTGIKAVLYKKFIAKKLPRESKTENSTDTWDYS